MGCRGDGRLLMVSLQPPVRPLVFTEEETLETHSSFMVLLCLLISARMVVARSSNSLVEVISREECLPLKLFLVLAVSEKGLGGGRLLFLTRSVQLKAEISV